MARARKKKIETPKPSEWSAGDRNEKTTGAILREYRVSTLIGKPVNPDKHIELIEVLEEVLDAATNANLFVSKDERCTTIEELPEAIRRTGDDSDAKEITRLEEHIDEIEAAHAKDRAERAKEVDDLNETIAKLRHIIELAEFALAETLKGKS